MLHLPWSDDVEVDKPEVMNMIVLRCYAALTTLLLKLCAIPLTLLCVVAAVAALERA